MKGISVFLSILFVLVVAMSGCMQGEKEEIKEGKEVAMPGEGKATEVRIAGSTTVFPLAEACAEEFNAMQKQYVVSVTSGGSGVGIGNAGKGISDIGMASREIKPEEAKAYETADKKFQEFLVGYDGICMVVSLPVYDGGIRSLTADQVKEIFSGNITNWKSLGGPDKRIFMVGRKAGSGTRDTFNEVIMGSKDAETPGVGTEAGDNSEVKTAVVNSGNAIGYVGYSYLGGSMQPIALNGIEPTMESIKDGSYSLSRKLYFYTLGNPSPGASTFINFTMSSEGQAIIRDNGFITP